MPVDGSGVEDEGETEGEESHLINDAVSSQRLRGDEEGIVPRQQDE